MPNRRSAANDGQDTSGTVVDVRCHPSTDKSAAGKLDIGRCKVRVQTGLVAQEALVGLVGFHRVGFFLQFELTLSREELHIVSEVVRTWQSHSTIRALASGCGQCCQQAESAENLANPIAGLRSCHLCIRSVFRQASSEQRNSGWYDHPKPQISVLEVSVPIAMTLREMWKNVLLAASCLAGRPLISGPTSCND